MQGSKVMMNEPENLFLNKVRQALGEESRRARMSLQPEGAPPEEALEILDRIAGRERKDRLALLERLMEEGRTINLEVHAVEGFQEAADVIHQIAVDHREHPASRRGILCWRHPLLDTLNLKHRLVDLEMPFFPVDLQDPALVGLSENERRARIREALGLACIGVTSADFCVAHSATLVLRSRAGQPRAVSLAPEVHVAVIGLAQILADFGELYTVLKWHPEIRREGLGPNLTFITGPSKTADIELHIVYGVHGSRKVHLVVLTGAGVA